MKKKTINVTISFDYELAWGVWDTLTPSYLLSHVRNANDAVKRIIALHKQLEMPATWALVGLILHDNVSQDGLLADNFLREKDTKKFPDVNKIPVRDHSDLFYVDTEIVKELSASQFEIASHTYSHIYLLEADKADLERDFEAFFDLVKNKGFAKPVSIIFPKNQVNDFAIAMAQRFGFTCIRVNPDNFLYRTEKHGKYKRFLIRALRYLDAYLPINEMALGKSKQTKFNINLSEASIFFRPNTGSKFLDFLHFIRVVFALKFCEVTGRDFHIWTHPHNFGGNIQKSINNYERLLRYFMKKHFRHNIEFKNMRDLSTL